MADGRYFEKSFFRYISAPNCLINAKFGGKKHIIRRHNSCNQNSKFQISWWLPFWKYFSLYISCESYDFDEIWCVDANTDFKNGHVTKNKNFINLRQRTDAILSYIFRLHLSAILSTWVSKVTSVKYGGPSGELGYESPGPADNDVPAADDFATFSRTKSMPYKYLPRHHCTTRHTGRHRLTGNTAPWLMTTLTNREYSLVTDDYTD